MPSDPSNSTWVDAIEDRPWARVVSISRRRRLRSAVNSCACQHLHGKELTVMEGRMRLRTRVWRISGLVAMVAMTASPALGADFQAIRFVNFSNERLSIDVNEGRALETGSSCESNPRIESRTLAPRETSPAYRCGVTGSGMCIRWKRASDTTFSDWSGQSCGGWSSASGSNVKLIRVP